MFRQGGQTYWILLPHVDLSYILTRNLKQPSRFASDEEPTRDRGLCPPVVVHRDASGAIAQRPPQTETIFTYRDPYIIIWAICKAEEARERTGSRTCSLSRQRTPTRWVLGLIQMNSVEMNTGTQVGWR